MYQDEKIWIGKSGEKKIYIYPKMANRHGMIAGATGTGKTVTLKVLAESFSDCGIPVFLADIKGDLAGMCCPGILDENLSKRIAKYGLESEGFSFHACPTTFWDIYAEQGIPLRTTISEMGPLLLSQILNLNETQSAILSVIFQIADDEGLLLVDTKDLRSMLTYVGENAKEYSLIYGNIAKQSLAAIIRAVVALEGEGGDQFFGEPALNISDWFSVDASGRGMINILECTRLINNPRMYSTFMLWLMSELFENLPEVGDMDKPRMIFFFDEAHLLFDYASKTLLEKIEQVVKLIRSKGVGIYFCTQNPKDIPDGVMGQLGNKIQHALHAYTPAEQKAAKAAAQAFRTNPEFDTYEELLKLGTGEALVSVLDLSGIPTVAERVNILPPQSQMGAIEDVVLQQAIASNMLSVKYSDMVDRDSAYEFLNRWHLEKEAEEERLAAEKEAAKQAALEEKQRLKEEAAAEKQRLKEEAAAEKQRLKEEAAAEKARQKELEKEEKARKKAIGSIGSTAAGTIGREVGNTLGKTFGGAFGKKLGGNVGASLGRGIFSTFFKKN